MANELIFLNRIRADIGNVEGPISDLLELAGMSGFNDNYEPQAKPRLVGTYTINDYYTAAQLAAAQNAFDGLTIVPDASYLIDFNDLAVQTLDPEQPNYNPAVAIILQGHNLGTTTTAAPLGHGRWFMTKTQATALTNIETWFKNITTLTDSLGIVSDDTTQTYDFDTFDELQYFGVTGLANQAFLGCSNLESIVLSNITSLGGTVFYGCKKLGIEVNMPNLTTIGSMAFGGNAAGETGAGITKIISLGSSITSIPEECFQGCGKLESVILPSTVTKIGPSAFSSCKKLKTINISQNITDYGANAFYYCSSLDIDISDLLTKVISIGVRAFGICTKITGNLNCPQLTSLGTGAFLGSAAGGNGAHITSISDLGSITIIGEEVFQGCSALASIVLPSTLTTIGNNAFIGCRALKEATVHATTPPTFGGFGPHTQMTAIYVPPATVSTYKSASGWSSYSGVIQAIS